MNNNKHTIIEAVKIVLASHPEGLTAEEVYNNIIEKNLYTFKAKQPFNILLGTIRRQCYGIDFPSLRGSTGIGGQGLSIKPCALPLALDLGVQSYVGKREGVTVSGLLPLAL